MAQGGEPSGASSFGGTFAFQDGCDGARFGYLRTDHGARAGRPYEPQTSPLATASTPSLFPAFRDSANFFRHRPIVAGVSLT